MTEAERAELKTLHRKANRTKEEENRYEELLRRLFEEELYWGDSES